jgi:pyruvate dehydrogenase E1 component alpha subunit
VTSLTDPTTVLDAEHGTDLLWQMLRVRRFEEKCAELYSDQRIRGFLHLYVGEEAVSAGVLPQLRPDDAVVATYREHGQALLRGVPMRAVLAEMYGKVTGCSRGRGGSMSLFDTATRFYGGNAIVAGGLPIALGLALADSVRGSDAVTVCFFGDGATAEGEFHESLNLAALWRLPVLFACENNRYAMGTALTSTLASTGIALHASSYGMPAWQVDGMDVLAVEDAVRRALATVRGGGGPHFLELQTYRFRAHSMYDAERYRDKEEVAVWKRRDPIDLLVRRMRDDGLLDDSGLAAVEQRVADEVEAAIAFAEQSPTEPVEELLRHVCTEREPA